jgi:mannitol operon repressor
MAVEPFPDDLRRTNPNLEERFWPYINILNQESPRGKVLISTGLLEEQLKQILQAFMIEGKTADDLFEGGSPPFATFSSRISGCYVLGLINQDEYDDLTLIRRIRNDFAHRLDTSFDTPSVRDRCRELKTRVPDEIVATGAPIGTDAQSQFTTAAANLILRFVNRPTYVGRQRRTFTEWPF